MALLRQNCLYICIKYVFYNKKFKKMKKLFLFAISIMLFASCQKTEQFNTKVIASPSNVAFSLNKSLPYHVTVQATTADKKAQFVFSANTEKIYTVFETAVKDTSTVNITVELGEMISAQIVKK